MAGEPDHNEHSILNVRSFLISGIFFVAAILLGSWLLAVAFHQPPASAAEFGDTFGFANALFSALAFAFLIVTSFAQMKELALQRKSSNQQEQQLKEQRYMMQKQAFESTLFQMIMLHNEIVKEMDLDEPSQPTGRDCFLHFRDRMMTSYTEAGGDGFQNSQRAFELVFERHQSDLAHYFRNLYHIVKFIDRRGPKRGRRLYIGIIRAQLSTNELLILFYNCINGLGQNKFRPLVEKYHLLEHLPAACLIDAADKDRISSSAFESNDG